VIFKRWIFSIIIIFSILTSIIACNANRQTTPYTTSEVTNMTTPPISSEDINRKLQEARVAFGAIIPLPTYLPQGYAISDFQINQLPDLKMEVGLTISKPSKPDIIMSVTWWSKGGPFRILPSSANYTSENVSGGPGTYSNAILNIYDDKYDLWWSWIPVSISSQYPISASIPYYALTLSVKKDVPADELVKIAKSVRIPPEAANATKTGN